MFPFTMPCGRRNVSTLECKVRTSFEILKTFILILFLLEIQSKCISKCKSTVPSQSASTHP